ncbi:serpin B [Saccharicrinis carchari]|uniref:Serpin B n=1 Tax=Saccharicrinis carchari TaxID=1168039 RepID=A0A521BH56_SACCC|nr:serpin family protein [Saccharicrinis carchari]SMO46448.1 serpin B [Saccharicrinis carchari]
MTTQFVTYLCLLALSFTACDKNNHTPENNPYKPIALDLKSASLVESSNTFGANLFKEILEDEGENENILISPLSIFQALSMTRNGANGLTRDEMTAVLAFDESQDDDLNVYQKKLMDALKKADNKLTLDIANSIWYRNDETVELPFIQVNQDYFNAEVSALDFSDAEGAKRTINNWVDKQTKGKIPEIVDEVTQDHVMFLINAIYFYGHWQNEFDTKDTQKAPFYPEAGNEVTVDMMHQETDLGYAANALFTMVEIPYGNGHFNMVALMPNKGKKVKDIVHALNNENWAAWMESLSKQPIVLGFPKFKFEGDYKLKEPLISMGMPLAFSDWADFTGILSKGGIMISKVKHKTFIEVDEKGTEAAAVTSVEVGYTSVGPQKLHFTANKPFVFAITEKDTNTILFLGKLMRP